MRGTCGSPPSGAPLGLMRVLLMGSRVGRALYPSVGWTSVDDPADWMALGAPQG